MIVDKMIRRDTPKLPFDGLVLTHWSYVFFALTCWIVRPKYGVSSLSDSYSWIITCQPHETHPGQLYHDFWAPIINMD